MPQPFPHRRPSDNHIAIDQDLHLNSAAVDILASYQNHLTPEPEDVEGIRGPHNIGMHNTDSGDRDWGDGDLGEYFSALLDRAFCPHEVMHVCRVRFRRASRIRASVWIGYLWSPAGKTGYWLDVTPNAQMY